MAWLAKEKRPREIYLRQDGQGGGSVFASLRLFTTEMSKIFLAQALLLYFAGAFSCTLRFPLFFYYIMFVCLLIDLACLLFLSSFSIVIILRFSPVWFPRHIFIVCGASFLFLDCLFFSFFLHFEYFCIFFSSRLFFLCLPCPIFLHSFVYQVSCSFVFFVFL